MYLHIPLLFLAIVFIERQLYPACTYEFIVIRKNKKDTRDNKLTCSSPSPGENNAFTVSRHSNNLNPDPLLCQQMIHARHA